MTALESKKQWKMKCTNKGPEDRDIADSERPLQFTKILDSCVFEHLYDLSSLSVISGQGDV